jgi:hypothetical protein
MANWRSVVSRARFEQVRSDPDERLMDLIVSRLAPLPQSETTWLSRRDQALRRGAPARPVLYRLHLTEKSGRYERTD